MEKIMKPKYILGIVFIIAFIFGAYSAFSKRQVRNAIVYVLEQDIRAEKGISSVADYVNKQSAISLRDCPADFTAAYRRHQAAWRDAEALEEEIKYIKKRYYSATAFLESFLRGMIFDFSMVGDADDAIKRARNRYSTTRKEITDTWHEVLNIAESYGVETTAYRSTKKD